jgi:hypothetical protein
MTTIDHAGPLAVSESGALTDERIARRALQVARRTALGVLGDTEAAADVAQEVAITAVRRAASLRDPAALDAYLDYPDFYGCEGNILTVGMVPETGWVG